MKQLWKKIIMSAIIVAIFIAPISAGFKTNENGQLAVRVEKNEARAQELEELSKTDVQYSIKNNNISLIIKTPINSIPTSDGTKTMRLNILLVGYKQPAVSGDLFNDKKAIVIVDDTISNITKGEQTYNKNYNLGSKNYQYGYGAEISIYEQALYIPFIKTTGNSYFRKIIHFTKKSATNVSTFTAKKEAYTDFFNCSWLPTSDWNCKIASTLYYIVFVPISAFTWISAQILDFFVYYSINSSSYTAKFIDTAWGAVRDISNIFFIIALLYVGLKTILNLNVTNNKKLIGAIIIIALVINFSLFTTKVVIDGSNILAKVFYNNMTSKDENDKTLEAGKGGQKSISVGLVDQFDPQSIFTDKNGKNNFEGNEGSFMFVTLLSIVLMGFLIYVFISVALLFVSRVISLWLAMIFSPIAFASYTIPFDIPGFGHKGWWSELLKNAFLAPVFIFFLYIIFLFGDAMKNLPLDINNTGSDLSGYLDAAMKTIIPFIIIFILLIKAKKLTLMYSGEMGKAIMTGAKMAGGLAIGAATGGTALLSNKVIGGKALSVANNDERRAKAASGNKRAQRELAIANTFAKSSFDFRQTGLGKGFGRMTGMDLNKGTGFLGVNTEKLKGGQMAKLKREKEKDIEKEKTYRMTGVAASKQDDLARDNQKQNNRAKQYKEDREEARARMESEGGAAFNESEFKADYESGKRIAILGKNIESGPVENVEKIKTSKEINKERNIAYTNNSQEKADKDEARGAFEAFGKEWLKGMKKMTTTKAGLATTLTTTAITGGLGTGVAIVGGGFLHAFKEVTLGIKDISKTNAEVIASTRKGEGQYKDLVKELKKMTEGGHNDSGKLADIAKKMTDKNKDKE